MADFVWSLPAILPGVEKVWWAIGAGMCYGAGLLFIPEALLNFRMGSIWWGLYAAFQVLALLTLATWCAGKAWRLYQTRDD